MDFNYKNNVIRVELKMKAAVKIAPILVLISCFININVFAQVINSKESAKLNIKPAFSLPATPILPNDNDSNLKQENTDKNKSQVIESSLNLKSTRNSISHIEKIFNTQEQESLIQFGYDIFSNNIIISANSKISSGYKLTIGDKVNVYLWGDSLDLISITGNDFVKSVTDITVDKDGNIFIPGVGVIQAKDKTVSNIEQQISSALSGKFTNFRVKVSVNDIGTFPVFAMGNVRSPWNSVY
jgi:hypothetical protein